MTQTTTGATSNGPRSVGFASLGARIDALATRHAELHARIEDEHKRPQPNDERLRLLKSRKLMIKDDMTHYQGVMLTLDRRHAAKHAAKVAQAPAMA